MLIKNFVEMEKQIAPVPKTTEEVVVLRSSKWKNRCLTGHLYEATVDGKVILLNFV